MPNLPVEITNRILTMLNQQLKGEVLIERESGQRIHVRVVEGGRARHLYIRVSERKS